MDFEVFKLYQQSNQTRFLVWCKTTSRSFFPPFTWMLTGECTRNLDPGVTVLDFVRLYISQFPLEYSHTLCGASTRQNLVSWHDPGRENIFTTTLLWKHFNIGDWHNSLGETRYETSVPPRHAFCLFECIYSVIYDFGIAELCYDPFSKNTSTFFRQEHLNSPQHYQKCPTDVFCKLFTRVII